MHVNRVRCTPISTSLNGNLCLEFVRIRERFRRFYRFLCTKCTVKAISDKSNSQDLLSDIRLLRLTWSFLFLTIFLCNLFFFLWIKNSPHFWHRTFLFLIRHTSCHGRLTFLESLASRNCLRLDKYIAWYIRINRRCTPVYSFVGICNFIKYLLSKILDNNL